MPDQGDVGWVTAEVLDVALHPPQRLLAVLHRSERRITGEGEQPGKFSTIPHPHLHDPLARKRLWPRDGLAVVAFFEAAAMQIDHHGVVVEGTG